MRGIPWIYIGKILVANNCHFRDSIRKMYSNPGGDWYWVRGFGFIMFVGLYKFHILIDCELVSP